MDQILETMFHQLSKHLEFCQKYSAAPGQFSILFSAFGYPDETLSLVFDIERFSFECRKVIGFAFATLHYWLKNSRQFFIQSEVKPKPIVTLLPRVFQRFASATCNYFEFWLVHCIVCSLWLARVITLVLVLRHSTENHSIMTSNISHILVKATIAWAKTTLFSIPERKTNI